MVGGTGILRWEEDSQYRALKRVNPLPVHYSQQSLPTLLFTSWNFTLGLYLGSKSLEAELEIRLRVICL